MAGEENIAAGSAKSGKVSNSDTPEDGRVQDDPVELARQQQEAARQRARRMADETGKPAAAAGAQLNEDISDGQRAAHLIALAVGGVGGVLAFLLLGAASQAFSDWVLRLSIVAPAGLVFLLVANWLIATEMNRAK